MKDPGGRASDAFVNHGDQAASGGQGHSEKKEPYTAPVLTRIKPSDMRAQAMRATAIRCGTCGTELGTYAKDHVCPVAEWGVWCIEDRAWCQGTIGTREHAEAELPSWVSGEAADVNPAHFHYELRRVTR